MPCSTIRIWPGIDFELPRLIKGGRCDSVLVGGRAPIFSSFPFTHSLLKGTFEMIHHHVKLRWLGRVVPWVPAGANSPSKA